MAICPPRNSGRYFSVMVKSPFSLAPARNHRCLKPTRSFLRFHTRTGKKARERIAAMSQNLFDRIRAGLKMRRVGTMKTAVYLLKRARAEEILPRTHHLALFVVIAL